MKKNTEQWYRKLAFLSWVLPLFSFLTLAVLIAGMAAKVIPTALFKHGLSYIFYASPIMAIPIGLLFGFVAFISLIKYKNKMIFINALIGILLNVALYFVFINHSHGHRPKITQAKMEISKLEGYVKLFRMDHARFPTAKEGLEILVVGKIKYLEDLPSDPWGNDYLYINPGKQGRGFGISSAGPDEEENTDDDIKNWKKN